MRDARRKTFLTGTHIERFVRTDGDDLVFAAVDDCGPLEVIVGAVRWEELQVEAPVWGDAEDRRDHALGMIETAIADRPIDEASGRRRVRIG